MKKQVIFLSSSNTVDNAPYHYDVTGGKGAIVRAILDPVLAKTFHPSVLLRHFMHARIIAPAAPAHVSVACTTDTSVSDAVVVVHKVLMNDKELLCKLKEANNCLLADIIDGNLDPSCASLFNAVICCSHNAYDYYSSSPAFQCPIYFVEHCVDIRISSFHKFEDFFSPYYFGIPDNLLASQTILNTLTVHWTCTDGGPSFSWIDDLKNANFHYAVRPKMKDKVFKPFTKGFVASRCSSNILVHKDDGDAMVYLGSDYPYLIHEDLNDATILRYMEKAKEDFGGKEWNEGLERMRHVRDRVSVENVSAQFWGMLKDVL